MLAARQLSERTRSQRTCAKMPRVIHSVTGRWTVSQYDCDLFVVGAGAGGVRAARMAAAQGLKVVVAEAAELGGTCVNLGCIPKKLLAYAARYRDEFSGAAGYGWSVAEPTLDWPTLRDAKQGEVRRLNGIYQRLLDEAGAEVIRGHARLPGPDVVAV